MWKKLGEKNMRELVEKQATLLRWLGKELA